MSCGHSLDGGPSPAGATATVLPVAERRVASVLFVDLVGFTPLSEVRDLLATYTQGRTFGFLGEPAVSVPELNIALDQLSAKSAG